MSHYRLNASVVSSAQRTGKLDLHGRSLYSVPADVFNASAFGQLATLDLSENKLAELPGDIQVLQSLREIYLDSNQLTTLPVELLRLPNLKAITLENNPRLDPSIRALYDKAQPLFRSRARDVSSILAWLAGQGGNRSVEPSPLLGAGRSIGGFASDRAADRDRDRDEPAAARPSYQPSALAADDDEDYMYAQMRARAAARAAALDAPAPAPARSPFNDSPSPPPQQQQQQQQQREYGRDREQDRERDYERDYERNNERERDYGRDRDYGRERSYDRDRDLSPSGAGGGGGGAASLDDPRGPSQGARSDYSRGSAPRESPFAQDAGLKMESRDSFYAQQQQQQQQQGGYNRPAPSAASANANDDAAARHKHVQRASNIFGGGEDDAPRHGRRAGGAGTYNRAGGGAPFGTDLNAESDGPRRAGGAQRAPAPFGTDLNTVPVAARRQADPNQNYTSVKSPWAVEGTGNAAQPQGPGERRGVRMTRPDGAGASPFGTLPASLSAAHYQTSSASAASHVQAAHRVRAQGGLDTHAAQQAAAAVGPTSPSHYADGGISGNGPRNSSGMRNYGRPNSDVFPAHERREIGNFEREPASYPQQQGRGLNPPFGRDTDAQAPHAHRSNRNNQSSIFDDDAPAPTHGGKSAASRPVKSTNLW